ncbi:hypothetical protein INS49_015776 [Diaporthe citri]|uniref:uncharacterized protein n=1 Tax=Diaporthe citri TaxID=83186 RepID=UPI001C81A5C6|nr:uncharacterized protein INS49_015776 [Diaporthe citri]KAG6356388.1 hypothetical protein INS49_015776 [Diaporthe citri]
MEAYTNFASYDMTLDDIDPSEMQQILQQIRWEQSIEEQIFAGPEYDITNFNSGLSPLSGYASPSSMTTGSTNQSPVVPLLDYDMSFPVASSTDDPENLFPELMDRSINVNPDCVGSTPEGYSGPFPTSGDAQVKVSSIYPIDSQLYPTAAPEATLYNNNSTFEPYPTTQPPPASAQTPQPTPTPSSQNTTATKTDLTCSHCGATFTDKTKLKVHTNKHTKPFRCAAAGCDYATAEKKSLQRHLLAKSKWDEEHRAAAQSEGVRQVKHRCPRAGCTYSTIREDNLKRHINTCA